MKNRGPGSMNRAFRLVWNESVGAYVAVAELASARGKGRSGSAKALAAVVLAGGALSALAQTAPPPTALPQGGVLAQGQAQWTQSGARLDVNQGSSRAAINWQSFNIGAQAQVQFNQPGASAVALNRVVGADMSQIFGKLTANGQVLLINPNGIVFGQGSQVDVSGLVASTLNLADDDFMAGHMRFTRGASAGAITNQGSLTAADGGFVALLAPQVLNEGVITARLGTVALAGGDAVTLNFEGAQLLGIKVDPSTIDMLIDNRQAIVADGGQVILAAGVARQLMQQAVAGGGNAATSMQEQDGVVRLVSNSGSISAQGGHVAISGGNLDISGDINAREGGQIQLAGDYVGQSSRLDVSSVQGAGGSVQIQAETVVQTAQAVISADGGSHGGSISITGSTGADSTSTLYSSATLSAQSAGGQGGNIDLSASSLQLRAATLDASGVNGGRLRVGGGFHGADADLGDATTVGVNAATVLNANANAAQGTGGQVVVWSDSETLFAGSINARGGSQSGAGGTAEVSSHGSLAFQGVANLGSASGHPGQLLLDPQDILIDDASAALATLDMSDPTPSTTNGFGTVVSVLSNGNVVVTAPEAATGSTAATGAAYLFNSSTGALLANLRGSNAGDKISSGGIQVLANGNYLVMSPDYATTAATKTITTYNSNDSNGSGASPAPTQAYVLQASSTASAGAITWQAQTGSGSASVSSANSLVGSTANTDSMTAYTYSGLNVVTGGSVTVTANDRVGSPNVLDSGGNSVIVPGTQVTELSDGNLAIAVPTWFNGRGAVAWMNGSTGQLANGAAGGVISASTALVGSTPNRSQAPVAAAASDGTKKVYVIGQSAPYNPLYTPDDLDRFGSSLPYTYSDGGTNRRTAPPGAAGDLVGQLVTALPGGAYVINTPLWTNGSAIYAGAVTYAASGGLVGTVGTGNSLTGSSNYDFVGSGGVTPVGSSGQNYVVLSPYWSGNGNAAAGRYLENSPNGAVTWVDGSNGNVFGAGSPGAAVSSADSLIGNAGDGVGAYSLSAQTPYTNYNYNSSTFVLNAVQSTRQQASLTNGLHLLANGNYLVDATAWTGSEGAVTFGLGSTGVAGVVSASNSLVGSHGADQVGQTIVELDNSNYVVVSPGWDNGSTVDVGAVSWGSGTSGRSGAVGSSNSLVGSGAYDAVGSGGVLAVGAEGSGGLRADYIVLSPKWGNRGGNAQSTVAYGAVTWVDGSDGQPYAAGTTGAAVSSSNSLVGSHAGDYVGSDHYGDTRSANYTSDINGNAYYTTPGPWDASLSATVDVLSNGSYVVRSPSWNGGMGAATLASGSSGLAGAISASNSLVGSVADATSTSSSSQSLGGNTWTYTTTYLTTTGDHVGLLGGTLDGGSELVISPFWSSGKGAITWLGSGNSTGTVSSSNSLVGSTGDTFSNANHTAITAVGDRLGTLASTEWATPVVSSATVGGQAATTTTARPVGPYVATSYTSYYGANYTPSAPVTLSIQSDGYGDITSGFAFNLTPIYQQLSNGNVLVASPNWNNGAATQAGAVTWIKGSNGQYVGGAQGGILSASNSLVGSNTGDYIGFRLPIDGVTELSNGNFVLSNSQWDDERGAVTWGSGTAGVAGTVSASNSLVGSTPSTSVNGTTPNQTVPGLSNPNDNISRYINGKGFSYDWPDRVTSMDGDRVGYGGVQALADGNAVASSPFWGSTGAWTQMSAPPSKGAATWINGSTGQLFDGSSGGAVGAGNSLVGSVSGDAVSYSAYIDPNYGTHYAYGGITVLAGGRYAVASPWWSNGAASEVGAVTFGPAGGIVGAVSPGNSLVGATAGDQVGLSSSLFDPDTYVSTVQSGVVAVTANGQTNYVVRSMNWTNTEDTATGGAGAGAITWVNGSTGHAYGETAVGATVGSSNSIVGSVAGDGVGSQYIALSRTVGNSSVPTGDLVFLSPVAYCGIDGYGAVTLVSGAQGASGLVSWRNSILGLAQAGNGQNTSTISYGDPTTDIQVALLPTAVTSDERVAYRPLIWASPNASSGNNSTSLFAATLVDESVFNPGGGNTADPINSSGGANWNGSRFVPDGSAFNAAGGSTSTGLLGFSANPSTDVVITPAAITGMLDAGTSVTLQANNDIRVAKAITTTAGGAGGNLTLEAGRSVYIDANITTDNGSLNLIANQSAAAGVVDADCSVCVSEIVQQAGTTMNAGTGNVSITLQKSTDKTSNAAGEVLLASVSGTQISITNSGISAGGAGQGVRFQNGAVIGTSATQSLTFLVGGSTATGGGLLLASDTQLVGKNDGSLQVAAADSSVTAAIGAANSGFGILPAEIGAVIQQSSGFSAIEFGRTDQAGATSIAALDLTQAAMQRTGASTLEADVTLAGGSGGVTLGGTLKSGVASDHRLTLVAGSDGTLALGNNSVTGGPGVLELATGGAGTVTQGASGGISAAQLLLSGDGTATLTGSANSVTTVAGHVGTATLKNGGTLTVGSIAGYDGLVFDAGGTVQAAGASSDVVLNDPLSTTTGNLVVVAGRNFLNNTTLDTGLDPGTGQYFVYSSTPSGTTEGMSSYDKHYNQSYSAGSTPAYAGSGNWFLYSTAPTLSVSVGAGSTITYGTSGAVPGVNITGFIDGDTQGSATTGSLALTTSTYTPSSAGFIPAGTYSVNLTGQGSFASPLGYQISVTAGSSSFVVNPKPITVSGLTANNKVYDGTTTAQVSGTASISAGGSVSSDGLAMTGDVISISGSATGAFATRNAGTGKSVTLAGLTLSGADAGDYTISAGSVQADITPKALSLSGLSVAASKVYDGGTAATPLGTASLAGTEAAGSGSTSDGKPYAIDTVSLSGTATAIYDSSQVANASQVQFGGLMLTGANAGNYTLSLGTQAATITPKALTVSGTTVASRSYDGTMAATLANGTLVGIVGGDNVTLAQSGSFADKNAGTNKPVTASDSLGGTAASNYALTEPTGLTGTITPKALTVGGSVASDKTYDGLTTATLTGGSLAGVIGGDTVTLTQAGNFADRNAGTAKPVTAADSLGGTDAGNYTLTQPTGLSADILARQLTVNGTMVGDKTYDGTLAATLSGGSLVGLVGGDAVTLTQAGSFGDKNAGTAKTVTAVDSLGGGDAGNYILVQPTSLSASILPKSLTVTGTTASPKVYDGTTTATLTGGSLVGVVGSDTLTLTQAGSYSDKNAGTGKTVTPADSLGGGDAGNYVLVQPASLTADITPKSLTVTGTTASAKTYDGTTAAQLSGGSLVGVVGGDTLTLTQAGNYSDKNAGTGKTVTPADSLGGGDAGNYVLTQPAPLTADILPKTLTVTGTTVAAKTYDGTTAATLSGGSLVGIVSGDTLSLNQAGSYSDKNAGTGKTVTAADSLGGSDAGNYVLTQPGSLSADISPKTLTVSGTTIVPKVYDGTTAATLGGGSLVGLVGGDTVALNQAGSYSDKNVGTGKTVIAADSLGGGDAGNYVLTQPGSLTADITPKSLTVIGTTVSTKTYDGTPAATLLGGSLVGLVGGDMVGLTQAGNFPDKNVGTSRPVTAADLLSGADAGNYALSQPTGLSADVTPKVVTVTGTTVSPKAYDGTTAATLTGGSLVGLVSGDMVMLDQAGNFSDKNAGSGKAVTAADTLSGADAANYAVSQPTGLSASVSARTVTVTGTSVADKVYDGTTAATLSGGSLVGLVSGDTITLTQIGSFADKNVGTAKPVTVADVLGGAQAGDYAISEPGGLSASITPKALAVQGLQAQDKVYDGSLVAQVSTQNLQWVGLVPGDQVQLSVTGSFSDKNVGTAKPVTLLSSLAGADIGNYSVSVPTQSSASITPRPLAISGVTAQNKVYDGTTAATLDTGSLTLAGLVSGDAVSAGFSGQFSDKNAATGKTVLLAASVQGADAGNYAITTQPTAVADITPRGLVVTADNQHKTYGDADPALSFSLGGQGLAAGDTVAGSLQGQLAADTGAAATAGTHAITLGTLSVDANYQITQFVPATLTVDKAPLTLSFNPLTKVYGDPDPSITWSVNPAQLRYSDTAAVAQVSNTSVDTGAQATAGSHTITGQVTAANYLVTVQNGLLTVTQAPLTVSADDKAKNAGQPDPALTWSVDTSQLRYQDTITVVQNVGLNTATNAGTPPGNYPIVISGATAQNYQITLVNGVLVIGPSPALNSGNLQTQVTVTPPTNSSFSSVTQPVLSAPLPPAGGTAMGNPGTLTVLGGGVTVPVTVVQAGATAITPVVAPGTGGDAVTAPAPAQPISARLVVIQPVIQVQTLDLSQGIAGDRLFSPPSGTQVTYSATLADGRPLPSWMSIDSQTGRLQGQPPAGTGVVEVQIVAQTSDGQSAQARIRLNAPGQ